MNVGVHHTELSGCESEPIRTPGSIQPHGFLLAFDVRDGTLALASRNTPSGWGRVEDLIGTAVDRGPWPRELADAFKVATDSPGSGKRGSLRTHLPEGAWVASAHRSGEYVVVDFEPEDPEGVGPHPADVRVPASDSLLRDFGEAVEALAATTNVRALCEAAVERIRALFPYDRVTVYRFDADWNGEVVAEARSPGTAPYLGLHFPASDIPPQARGLYVEKHIRYTPDVEYVPVPLIAAEPAEGNGVGSALDLGQSILRSISPVHVEYLRNMSARASMSLSLMKGGRLWGLISCVNCMGPLAISPARRELALAFARVMSSYLEAREEAIDFEERRAHQRIERILAEKLTLGPDFVAALERDADLLRSLVGGEGVHLRYEDRSVSSGLVPEGASLEALRAFVGSRLEGRTIWSTERLAADWPEAAAMPGAPAGVLAVSLGKDGRNLVLWTRSEVARTITWGGDPRKALEAEADGRIHPRKSFRAWREIVEGRSPAWDDEDVASAERLRRLLLEAVVRRSAEILQLNTELERSNDELDSFAYAASHDLKEPLRGIHNFTSLALRDLKGPEGLTPQALDRLETVTRLTQRMEALIESLLHYAQVGRAEFLLRPVDTSAVALQAIEMLRTRVEEMGAEVRVAPGMPVALCDRVRLGEVFANLIGNALKYNDKSRPEIEVGCLPEGEGRTVAVYYVKDNGIGIAPEYADLVFRIFKRLHGRDKFGGGTGTGLTIARRIVDRHHGRIWLESVPGRGTTFFFTLGTARDG